MPAGMIEWNEANLKTLTDMWRDGVPVEEISLALVGHRDAKSAVVGKANRMKLGEHANSRNRKGMATRAKAARERKAAAKLRAKPRAMEARIQQRKSKPIAVKAVAYAGTKIEKIEARPLTGDPLPADTRYLKGKAWLPLPGSKPVSLMERTEPNKAKGQLAGCCWIVTQDSPWLYCNRPVAEDSTLSYCDVHTNLYLSKDHGASK